MYESLYMNSYKKKSYLIRFLMGSVWVCFIEGLSTLTLNTDYIKTIKGFNRNTAFLFI